MKAVNLIALILFPFLISAQEIKLFESINYRNAVKNGTRSHDGKPGPNYWQNHADYDIKVRLDTAERKIFGEETVIYYNESPDTLTTLVVRLYQNTYKKGARRNVYKDPNNVHEGMELDTLMINNNGIKLEDPRIWMNGTNMYFSLNDSIPPDQEMVLYCRWNYKIPYEHEYRRHGYYKDNAWFIGYFYPQIAVYDDMEMFYQIKGWDLMLSHMGLQEFYNDFNNYKVEITVPEGFFVWATGELLNPDQVYKPSLIERIKQAKSTSETIHILTEEQDGSVLLTDNKWIFQASNVPDFGFGTAPGYLWDGTSVQVGDRRIFVDVVYHPDSKPYPIVIDVAREAVKYASEVYPAVEYPYSHATTFNGNHGGGMEFPMIANNANDEDTVSLYHLTFHEIFHNYLPFMMGINEKRYPFMDEGLNELFSHEFLQEVYNVELYADSKNHSYFKGLMERYNFSVPNDDFPLINTYSQISLFNLYYYYYVKPLVAYNFFIDMIGKDQFIIAFKEFIERWEGKHPSPYDFFYTMNDVLGENFNWYWKSWFFDLGYPDLSVHYDNGEVIVKRVGEGSLPLPVRLIIEKIDGSTYSVSRSAEVWKDGTDQITIELEDISDIKSISIDKTSIPDIDRSNNQVEIE